VRSDIGLCLNQSLPAASHSTSPLDFYFSGLQLLTMHYKWRVRHQRQTQARVHSSKPQRLYVKHYKARSRTNLDSARRWHLLNARKGKISAENMHTNSNKAWRLRDHTQPCRLKTTLYLSKINVYVVCLVQLSGGKGRGGKTFLLHTYFVQKRGGEVRDFNYIYVWLTKVGEGFYNYTCLSLQSYNHNI